MKEKRIFKALTSTLILATSVRLASHAQEAQPYQGVVGRTLAESKEWWPKPVTAPASAPNVIWILIDDVGYGASETFGGLIKTPVMDSLANNGLRYTNFHTCAICAPTRSALLTGRNSASVHESGFSHTVMSAGFPGWDGRVPATAGTIAEILRDNGYNTFAVGKYGITPDEEATDAGPFDHWPTGMGFDHFFGFLGSQTDQYHPDLVEDQAYVRPDGRHLSEQITDKAIFYIDRQHKVAPNKPFFLYYAPGATHAPHQVDKYWSDQYKGQFDKGWDWYREQVFERQKKLGVIPANAVLPDRNSRVTPWDKLSPEEKKLYARFMEVYAGYLTYTDFEIGRLVNHLKETGQLDNTLIFISIGDNGASKEGSLNGTIDQAFVRAKPPTEKENIDYNLNKIGEIGTPSSTNGNYPLGWAQAADTPFKFWKQDANSEGGTHNPLIAYWPNGIKDKGGIRYQYSHVIDLLPTTLDLVGIKSPDQIRGIKQQPIEGFSFADSINNADAPWHHSEQYYYIFGSRSIYKDGWKAELAFPNDLLFGKATNSSFDENAWELYNLKDDPTERIDLAQKNPEKLAELKAEFEAQAKAHNLYPYITWDDVFAGRIHRTPGSKPFIEAIKDVTKSNDNQ
jgi:arylsulfatase A-like enzyme